MRKRQVTIRPPTLRAFRQIRGWSQLRLAEAATAIAGPGVSVSESLIALIETGRRQPSLATAQAIADGLGIPLDALAVVEDGAEAVA